MSQDLLRGAFDTLRARLQADLDEQLSAIEERQAEAVNRARQAAEADADQRWSVRLEEARAEWAVRLESELAAAGAEAERRGLEDAARLRAESEQTVLAARDAVRHECEQTLGAERERVRHEREQAHQQLEQLRGELSRAQAEIARLQQELDRAQAEISGAGVALERTRADFESEQRRVRQAHEEALSAARTEQAAVSAALEQERMRARELDTAQHDSVAAREQALTALTAVRSDLDAARAQVEQERARAETLEAERDEAVAALAEVTTALNETQAELLTVRREAAAQTADHERVQALGASLEEARAALRRTQEEARVAVAAAAERQAQATTAEAEGRSVERQWRLAIVERMLGSVSAISGARSLSDTLAALVAAAAAEAPRTALFIVNGPRLQGWRVHGFGTIAPASLQCAVEDRSALGDAARRGEAVSTAVAPAPAFAALPPDRIGLAVPVTVGGHAVAVLYADDGSGDEPETPASWPEAVQLLGRHASACLAHLTALRTAQAMRATPVATSTATPQATRPAGDETSAKRYARLLVSEIKLYNEGAVRVGREKRDLLHRLRAEIERARRLYEERVPDAVGARSDYFQQELVQTLADGDAALLGEPV
jgi:chromosome segregation ATPase